MTVFLGCGFAAKYREGGGNFSVPLQWMLGLRRMNLDAVWVEFLPGSGDAAVDAKNIRAFQLRMRQFGFAKRYALLLQREPGDVHVLEKLECFGLSKKELAERLAGPNVLLNLSYSLHPPLLHRFERRILCDLDPSEIFYWMTKLEMGQSHHHEFWTIGLNAGALDCLLPQTGVPWKTFYPLVDTTFFLAQPPRTTPTFTTIGQWYWGGAVEVNGEFPDLSKKFAFEPYLDLPSQCPACRFELAMNINADDPEYVRLRKRGWQMANPHHVARTPGAYRNYIRRASGEFTAIKGVDVAWKTGWLSDRAAAFLASGRPVITEDAGARSYLPADSGMHFVRGVEEARAAVEQVTANWSTHSAAARACAVELFDAPRNLRRILAF